MEAVDDRSSSTYNDSVSSASSAEFDEEKVRFALLPFFSEDEDVNRIADSLRDSRALLKGYQLSADSSQVLDELLLLNTLPSSSLYKILLSGCVSDHPLLQSAVQALMERFILRSDAANRALANSSYGSSADQQRRTFSAFASPDLCDSGAKKSRSGFASSEFHPEDPVSGGNVPSSMASDNGGGINASLTDCLRSLQRQHSRGGRGFLLQGPISASASHFLEQQSSSSSARSAEAPSPPHSSSVAVVPLPSFASGGPLAQSSADAVKTASPFLSAADMQSQLQASMGESFRAIAAQMAVNECNRDGEPRSSSSSSSGSNNHHKANVESAAEALLGLIQN